MYSEDIIRAVRQYLYSKLSSKEVRAHNRWVKRMQKLKEKFGIK